MERAELARLLGQPSSAAEGFIEEADPLRFMRAFADAVHGTKDVVLADPGWGAQERAQCRQIRANVRPASERGWLMIPSGGTSGRLKLARHDQHTIAAAVKGFRAHFQMEKVNTVGLLPLHHVSGLMAWLRSVLTGGTYLPWNWKDLEAARFPAVPPEGCVSLVPTQLRRLIESGPAVEWLKRFRIVFVGGGPLWPALADRARNLGLPISIVYGMTETAAMVAALRPEEFLSGGCCCGAALPHARLAIRADRVQIEAGSLFLGYYPEFREPEPFLSEDLGSLDGLNRLQVYGRRDSVVITGGKKVDPLEVEGALLATGEFDDIAVLGIPSEEWGQELIACYPAGRMPQSFKLAEAMERLAPHKRPKRFLPLRTWPRNAQGKVSRAQILELAAQASDFGGLT